MSNKITVQEIQTLFGETMPIEAAMVLQDGSISIDDIRTKLKDMADAMLPLSNKPVRLLAEWIDELPLQMQAVLVLACRGCDGVPKDHGHKALLMYYRACVMRAAHTGRILEPGEHVASLMTMRGWDTNEWASALYEYRRTVEELPAHFSQHFRDGVQIMAYLHPQEDIRRKWLSVYGILCDDLNLVPEDEEALCLRLADFGRPLHVVVPYTTGEL